MHLAPHDRRPDGDNLEKFLNDALSGIVWDDDARISWLVRSKTWTIATEGETIIYVKQISTAPTDFQDIINTITEHISLDQVPNATS